MTKSFLAWLSLWAICWLNPQQLFAQNYQLIFADEFDGTAVNPNNWEFQLGDGTEFGIPGWGNNEKQFYREENANVEGGLLTITAREEFFGGYNYTSTRLRSQGLQEFTYGRFEMRAKLPIGQGMWPAFWLLFSEPGAYGGWAASGEIDIMEYIGSEPTEIFGTIHYGEPFPGNVFSEREVFLEPGQGTFNDDFHTFAIEWEPGEIRWFLDGELYATQNDWWSNGGPYPAPFDGKFHMLLNLAVGGNLPGDPDETTVFPQTYVIDYVRVYEDVDLPQANITNITTGANFNVGETINVSVDATTPNGLDRVELYQGDIKLGELAAAPFDFSVPNAAEGSYRLRAIVYDQNGKRNYSDFVDINVGNGGQGPYRLQNNPIPGVIEIENFDVGGQDVAYSDNDPQVNQGTRANVNRYRNDEGPDLENTTDDGGGQNLAFTNAGEWLEYTVDVQETGLYDVTLRVASESATGSFSLDFNGVDKTGIITTPATGGFQTWVDVTKENVALEAGIQVLRFNILTNGINVNKMTITTADAASGNKVTFDDMEHGDPINNGWFAFGGGVGGGGIDANSADLPPNNAGSFSLQTGWGSGGTPGFFGAFGRRNLVDLTETTFFNLWINPDAGQDFTLEINLQEDDNGDGNIPDTPDGQDDEFQYNLSVGSAESNPDAVSGGGWQLVSIPLSDFVDDNSFHTGGNGILDATRVSEGGNGELVNIVVAVVSNSGADATFRTDFWSFTNGPLGAEINANVTSLDFGQVAQDRNAFRIIKVQNEGCTELNVSAAAIEGTDAAEFQVEGNPAPFTVLPGAEFDLFVSFNPTSLGAKTADLVITSDDADEGEFRIPLSGEGVEAPDINKVLFDDMEHGDPFNNGWGAFGGAATGGISANNSDLPPEDGGQFSLEGSWTSGGAAGFYGGFLRTNLSDLTDMTHFNFWINPDAGQDYVLEINLQDDDNGDNEIPFPSPDDDEFQYNFRVGDASVNPDAVAGGGWQLISIPFTDFFDDNSIHTGNGTFDPFSTVRGGNGQLVNIVIAILSNDGNDVSFRTDFWCFSEGPLGQSDAVIALDPRSINFGSTSPGNTKPQTLTISNEGGAPLEITALNFTGTDAADFSTNVNLPLTIDIVQSQDITVNFSPSSQGAKTAQLVIESNDPINPSVIVDLVGEGSDFAKVIFDDMEHGDPLGNGWFTFGGAVGGGGIDPNGADLPPVNGGNVGIQTGWGSGGTPGFFGGFGRTNPVDLTAMTHFNFWINPDADQDYILEINLQEDDDNDGAFPFPAPNDDEFQYNLTVGPAGSGAEVISGGGWQLVSIPFTDFFDDNSIHGGNGVFDPFASGNGELISIVYAVISNSGADVSFRSDFWCFSEGPLEAKIVFDDMEHGDPLGNGWFTFGGAVGGGGLDPNFDDLPPANGGDAGIQTGWGSGGTPGFFGGFGRNNAQHIAAVTHFNLWINPDAGQDYILEINLQEDDNGDGAFPFPAPDDDEFQYNLTVGPAGSGAEVISGGGWQLVSIPLADFFDDNSIHGGNGVFDPVPTASGGNGELLGIVMAVISNSGADVSFRSDFWCFSDGPLDPPTPEILVNPASLDFGLSSTNGTNSQIVTISNNGPVSLQVSDLNFSGTDAADFSIVGDTAFAVAAGESQAVTVNFAPSSVGTKTAQLSIENNDPANPSATVDLTGEGADQLKVVFDDMEHGDPLGNGWFTFGGAVGGGGLDPNFSDLPPVNGGNAGIQTGWGSGGTPGFFGGFGRNNPVDLTAMTHFNLWINPDAGQDYTLEINLQEDDNNDGAFPFPAPDDDEFQYNLTVGPAGSGAEVISGGGWQLVSIPFTDFFDDNSIHGGNGVFDPFVNGNGELIGVVIAVISNSGADVTFRSDFWCFSDQKLEPPFGITSFQLYDASSDELIGTLNDGDEIVGNDLRIGILAETVPSEVGSVVFRLDGRRSVRNTENFSVYSLFGNRGNDIRGAKLPFGEYTLTATPYTREKGRGEAGESLTVNFTVVDGSGTGNTLIESFTLIDAQTDAPVAGFETLEDGAVIDLSTLNNLLNIAANADPEEVGSVRFELDGPIRRKQVENFVPYALFSDRNGDFFARRLIPGTYTLSATAYNKSNARGLSGPTKTITFEVLENNAITISPNPTADKVEVQAQQSGTLLVINAYGRVIAQKQVDADSKTTINLGNKRKGVYFVRFVYDGGVINKQIMKY